MDHKPTRNARLLQTIDVAGTFVLAIQGASIAAVKGLDAFGVVVVSLATATGGGILRDLLIGESPPEALRGWPIVTSALLGAFTTFFALRKLAVARSQWSAPQGCRRRLDYDVVGESGSGYRATTRARSQSSKPSKMCLRSAKSA
jgi:Glycine transporter